MAARMPVSCTTWIVSSMSKYISEKKTVPVVIISRAARSEPSRMSAAVILFSNGQI